MLSTDYIPGQIYGIIICFLLSFFYDRSTIFKPKYLWLGKNSVDILRNSMASDQTPCDRFLLIECSPPPFISLFFLVFYHFFVGILFVHLLHVQHVYIHTIFYPILCTFFYLVTSMRHYLNLYINQFIFIFHLVVFF